MSPRTIPVEADGPTARLIKTAQGVQAANMLPAETAKNLVKMARAVRLFVEARECAWAAHVCREIAQLGKSAEAESAGMESLLARHTKPLIKTLERLS